MKMKLNNLVYGLPTLLVIACADTSGRYRDVHQLELPPVLPIEHTHTQPAIVADDSVRNSSPLAGMVAFQVDGDHPLLTLKTRPDRAWEMVVVALKLGNIEVLDKNREINRFQVRFDADTAGKEESLLDIFASDNYAEADYFITLKEDIQGIGINAALSKPDGLEFGKDASAELVRFLHKIINEKIINREPSKNEE